METPLKRTRVLKSSEKKAALGAVHRVMADVEADDDAEDDQQDVAGVQSQKNGIMAAALATAPKR